MTEFRTIIDIKESKTKLDHSNKIMLIGSCFAENIGNILIENKFNVQVNPYGILYNPLSVASCLKSIIENREFTEDDLIYHSGKWNSLSHHGKYSDIDKNQCLQRINANNTNSKIFLEECTHLIITFGTSWVYEHTEKGIIVSNCHKLPDHQFNRYRITSDDIVETYKNLIVDLRYFNPNLKIIFTVSPIRHWKDGAHGNQLSKAVLLLAIDELQERLPYIEYFPSYEILIDELRDYRFYADDMLHISPLAVNYIWERFKESTISPKAYTAMASIHKIRKSIQHRPLSPETEEYREFLLKLQAKIDQLEIKYPDISFSQERDIIDERINN